VCNFNYKTFSPEIFFINGVAVIRCYELARNCDRNLFEFGNRVCVLQNTSKFYSFAQTLSDVGIFLDLYIIIIIIIIIINVFIFIILFY